MTHAGGGLCSPPQIFEQLDFDASGTLDSEELMLALSELGLKPSPAEFQLMFDEYENGDGVIAYADFE